MGAIVGFLHKYETVQLAVLIGIQTLYTFQLFYFKPYLDRTHTYLDIGVSISNIIVIGLMFGFLKSIELTNTVLMIVSGLACAIILLSQILCILAFYNSWMKLNNIGSLRMLISRCSGNTSEASIDVYDIELPTTQLS